MPRVFTAVDLPDIHRERIAMLKRSIPGVRWIPEENLHITLSFFGEIPNQRFMELIDCLGEINCRTGELSFGEMGTFPKGKEPKVIFMSVESSKWLENLKKEIDIKARELKIQLESRKFIPHITFGRCRSVKNEHLADLYHACSELELPTFSPENFTLYTSHLQPDGSLYSPEVWYPLTDG